MGIGYIFASGVLLAMIAVFVTLAFRFRGERVVVCPETQKPVGARIDPLRAAGSWIVSQPHFEISACSRWPERAGCDQACVPQIEAAPGDTLVRSIVAKWYASRSCVYCGEAIGDPGGALVTPALRNRDGRLQEWTAVAAEDLPAILEQAVAVCARCDVTEDFRARFADRVIERPASPLREHAATPLPRHFAVAAGSSAVY